MSSRSVYHFKQAGRIQSRLQSKAVCSSRAVYACSMPSTGAPRLTSSAMHALLRSSYAADGRRTFHGVSVPSWISFSSSGQYFWQGVCIRQSFPVSRRFHNKCNPAYQPRESATFWGEAFLQRSLLRHMSPVSVLSSSDTDTSRAHADWMETHGLWTCWLWARQIGAQGGSPGRRPCAGTSP